MALLPVLDVAAGPADNVFYSPASIQQAFGIVALGARGDTRRQLETVLAPPPSARRFEHDRDGVTVRLANALWLSDQWRFRPAFVAEAARQHEATARTLDFTRPAEAARIIDAWADDTTEGLIREVVNPKAIDRDDVAYITNALYFDGDWAQPFLGSETLPFLFGDGSDRPFKLMRETMELAHAAQGDWTGVRLPYSSKRYAMDVIMPRDRVVMRAAPSPAEFAQLGRALDRADRRTVEMRLPQFEIDTSVKLIPVLEQLGLTLPFDRNRADLSGLVEPGQRPVYVGGADHIAKLQVFDTGTRAAAVTVVRIVPTGMRAPDPDTIDFRVDRPFLIVIRDLQRGEALFVGRIADPKAYEAAPALVDPSAGPVR